MKLRFIDPSSASLSRRRRASFFLKRRQKARARAASPRLLQPIMQLEIVAPSELTGPVLGDLQSRGGRIEGMETERTAAVIKGTAPLVRLFGYSTDLRSLTQGRGVFTMRFARFDEA